MHPGAALLVVLGGCSPPAGPPPELGAFSPDLACDAVAPVTVTVTVEVTYAIATSCPS